MQSIYLDYNTTTPMAPDVQDAILPFLAENYGCPMSRHVLGRISQEAVEEARTRVAEMLQAQRHEIVFTSSGSEANNLAIKGIALATAPSGGGHLVISAVEHASVTASAAWLETLGYDLSIVPCDGDGRVNPDDVDAAIRPDTLLVSVQHANHVVGTVQPVKTISDVCRFHDVPLHCDASQSLGKIPVSIAQLGVDMLTLSGHKMYAPPGVGVLFVREGLDCRPLIHGDEQEHGMRGGRENVPAIVGMGKAAALLQRSHGGFTDHLASLRDRLQRALQDGVGPELKVFGGKSERLPNTLTVNFPDAGAAAMLRRVPELCVTDFSSSAGGSEGLEPALTAMNLSAGETRGTIRLSVGWYTNAGEVDHAANLLIAAWEGCQGE